MIRIEFLYHEQYRVLAEGSRDDLGVYVYLGPHNVTGDLPDSIFSKIYNEASDRFQEQINGNADRLYDEMRELKQEESYESHDQSPH